MFEVAKLWSPSATSGWRVVRGGGDGQVAGGEGIFPEVVCQEAGVGLEARGHLPALLLHLASLLGTRLLIRPRDPGHSFNRQELTTTSLG